MSGFLDSPAGPVPQVRTSPVFWDRLGTLAARGTSLRNTYTVAPGLYAVGTPGPQSPVLVTANYKLSFDAVRCELAGVDTWLLVVDTRGVNVWCAAGKKTFSSQEVAARAAAVELERVVNHRRLVVPQLAATGVCALEVKRLCGFAVTWGPVRASDLPAFLEAGQNADQEMRRVTFTLTERAVLAPVELFLTWKSSLWVLAALFVLSGLGPWWFSLSVAWERFQLAVAGYGLAVLVGSLGTPLLLPWLPGRSFWIKGAVLGMAALMPLALSLLSGGQGLEGLALLLFGTATASFLGMNFTGSTPYTSPTGVEKEMRRGIPAQLVATVLAAACWIGAAFVRSA